MLGKWKLIIFTFIVAAIILVLFFLIIEIVNKPPIEPERIQITSTKVTKTPTATMTITPDYFQLTANARQADSVLQTAVFNSIQTAIYEGVQKSIKDLTPSPTPTLKEVQPVIPPAFSGTR